MLELPSFEFNNLLCYQLFWDISCLSYKIGIVIATPWTVAYQAPPSMGFSRQEYGSGLPFSSPEDLPDPGIEPRSPTLQADSLPSEPLLKKAFVLFSF